MGKIKTYETINSILNSYIYNYTIFIQYLKTDISELVYKYNIYYQLN